MKLVNVVGALACLAWAGNGWAQTAECAEPNVLILFDVSGSMNQLVPGGAQTKYVTAQRALSNAVQATEHRMRYGLTFFPQPGPAPVYCGGENYEVDVPIAQNNWQNIFNKISPTLHNSSAANPQYFGGPRGDYDTPLVQVLRAARTAPGLLEAGRRSYVILVSDGSQDCGRGGDYDDTPDSYPTTSPYCTYGANATCPGPFPYSADPASPYWNAAEYLENRDDAIAAVDALWLAGVDTFVVGFGAGADPATLNELAVWGGTADWLCTENCYFHADNQAQLEDALAAIAQIVNVEVCDGIDNDCDGSVDEGTAVACETACGPGLQQCIDGAYADCDAPQPTTEVCDGLDNNCDGTTDEGCECTNGETQSCGSNVGACQQGTQTCVNGTWGPCEGGRGPVPEVCDGVVDDDCDDTVDEGCECTNGATQSCGSTTGVCQQGTQTCINGTWGACEGGVGPSEELCDGVDNDCDGSVDEHCGCIAGETRACGSSFGICSPGTQTCVAGAWSDCEGDTPGQVEVCDNVDNDCDGDVDEGANCGGKLQCRCGACVSMCGAFDSCPNGAVCMDGYCIIDSCPENTYCNGFTCVPGENPNPNGNGSGTTDGGDGDGNGKGNGVDGGCDCSSTGPRAAADMMLLTLVLGATRLARRRAKVAQ